MKGDLARKFLRAAEQRLTAADLLWNEGFSLESMYLAGYGVECSSKALILRQTTGARRPSVLEEICHGTKGHDLEWLKQLLLRKGMIPPSDVVRGFRRVVGWSTDLRYEVGRVKADEAASFLDAAKLIYSWAERSM